MTQRNCSTGPGPALVPSDRDDPAQHAARIAAYRADILCSASLTLSETLDLDTVLNTLLDYLAALAPYDGAGVCLLGPGPRLSPRVLRGWDHSGGEEPCRGRVFDAQARQELNGILGRRQSLLIADRRDRPDWTPCRGFDYAQSSMSVPLIVDGQAIGLCELVQREPSAFTSEHVLWVEALVAQAEAAIHNAQVFDQIAREREELQLLSRHVVQTQEDERRMIARELHDAANQSLTSLKIGIKLLEHRVAEPQHMRAGLNQLLQQVDDVMDSLHSLAVDLRPPTLDHLGLIPALEQACAALHGQNGTAVALTHQGSRARCAPDVETASFRIVQEALLNAVHHAGATEVRVALEQQPGRLIIVVADDGHGFDATAVAAKGRLGLVGMQERAETIGGALTLESRPGGGTTVRLEVPCER